MPSDFTSIFHAAIEGYSNMTYQTKTLRPKSQPIQKKTTLFPKPVPTPTPVTDQSMPKYTPLPADWDASQHPLLRHRVVQAKTAAAEKAPNQTGMPDRLKAGLEQLSGLDLSEVRVHRNSSKPKQLQALAYTQGTNIYLGPGQEQHLPHEGWHVVQQMEGRVKSTIQMMGIAINDSVELEREANLKGNRALHMVKDPLVPINPSFEGNLLTKVSTSPSKFVIQRCDKSKFIEGMQEYRNDFLSNLEKVCGKITDKKKDHEFFNVLLELLYQYQIPKLEKDENYFKLVNKFHEEIIKKFKIRCDPIIEVEDILLWSKMNIGRFAVNNKEILRAAEANKDAKPMNLTVIGKLMDKLIMMEDNEVFTWNIKVQLWNAVSKEFAHSANGRVDVFIPRSISPSSIFWLVELPELHRKDNKVKEIYVHYLTKSAYEAVEKIHQLEEQLRDELTDEKKEELEKQKTEIMKKENSWKNKKILQAKIEVPSSEEGKKGSRIKLEKLRDILLRWHDIAQLEKAKQMSLD
jgi:hypothetical protein